MAEVKEESLKLSKNLSSKDGISLNESGIGQDVSILTETSQTNQNCSSHDESGIGKDISCNFNNSACEDFLDLSGTNNHSSKDNTENSKNGVIKDADENNQCKHSNECTNNTKNNEREIVGNDALNNTVKGQSSLIVDDNKTKECDAYKEKNEQLTLKKEDSGVELNRSPMKDNISDIDNSESHSECGALSTKTDSGVALSSQSKLSENDESSRDTGDFLAPGGTDQYESDQTGSCDIKMPSVGTDIDEVREMENENSSEEDEVVVVRTKKSRRKRRADRIDSSSDSNEESDENDDVYSGLVRNNNVLDSDDDSDPGVEEKIESDSESEEEESFENKNLKQTFKAITDLRSREYGFSKKLPPSYFREKVQASANLVKRMKLQCKLEYHDGCVNALHFNRIGTLLASGSDDLNVCLWNWIQQRPALYYESGHRSNVFQAKFMPFSGDCHVVSCARDGQIRLAELSLTGVCKGTKKLAQHRGAAHKLALELDSPHVFLSCGEDALTYGIDLREEKPNRLAVTKEGDKKIPLYSIHSNPGNSFEFCVGGRDHFIRIYDKRKIDKDNPQSGLLKKYCPHHLVDSDVKANVTCAVYNYNGTEVIGSYNDEDIYMFNNLHTDGAEYIKRYTGHRNNHTVKGVNFYGPKSEFIVSGSDCGHIFLWDKDTEEIVQYLKGDDCGAINVLEPHPTLPILATSGLDHEVKVWAPLGEEPTDLKGIKKAMKKNMKEREEERIMDVDMIDGQMLWYIMHHMPRARRRREREEEEGDSPSSESDNDSSGSEDMPRIPCAPS